MENLRRALLVLIRRIERESASAGGNGALTLDRLYVLYAAAEHAQQAGELTFLFGELRQYWLHSIDWCSQLSKDIEWLLILYDELSAEG